MYRWYSTYSYESYVISTSTYSEGKFVASVFQFVITCIESEGLHNIRPSSEELPVQLSH